METLTSINPSAFLNPPSIPLTSPSRFSLTKDDVAAKREIIDLKMKDMSYNQIVEHFAEHRIIKYTKHDISYIILEAGARAKHLNGIYDSMVRHMFKVIEIDEVFQGNSCCYLGVVDKESHYVLKFVRMGNRARESFKEELELLLDAVKNLEIIITDGNAVYKTLVPELVDGIVHLLCHVHSYRIFIKEADVYHRQAADTLKRLKKMKEQLDEARHALTLKQKQLKRLDQKVSRVESNYDAYRTRADFKKYSKKAPWTPERRELARALNEARSNRRSKLKTVKNKKRKIAEIKSEIDGLRGIYREKKQVSLQTGKILSWFKRFLSCPQDEFEAEREKITGYLQGSKYPIAGKVLKFIQDNPQLQPRTDVDLDEVCKGFNASTNMIESFFGLTRPLLDKARLFSDSPQAKALLEIYRLKYNLSRPFTGPNKDTTPLQRAGVNSTFNGYLEALFPPIPSKTGNFSMDEFQRSCTEFQFPSPGVENHKFPRPDCKTCQEWLMNSILSFKIREKNKS
ncbi:MAG: transposase [Candidatus Hodarchaeota archaeon]